jgi:hypothetical protein
MLRTALAGYDQMIGLDLDDLSVDGSITMSSGGGEVAGRSPVDRGKQGPKRSVACENQGIPLNLVAARANDHDSRPGPDPGRTPLTGRAHALVDEPATTSCAGSPTNARSSSSSTSTSPPP